MNEGRGGGGGGGDPKIKPTRKQNKTKQNYWRRVAEKKRFKTECDYGWNVFLVALTSVV